ncbi:hypothetical protein ABZ439_07380 [Streptomyces sp. NPDC005840]|uniref:hypothetical protein n=1 Tax=Streptomyces sp. NPDC005840 TaxID=3157072 RepID=UPI0033D32929
MAEHDSEREGREPEERGVPFDEDAAWAAIVAGYGEEPSDPPGAKPFKSVEDLALLESETNAPADTPGPTGPTGPTAQGEPPAATDPAGPGDATGPTRSAGPAGSADPAGSASPAEQEADEPERPERAGGAAPLGGSVSFAPGVGPRDYSPREPSGGEGYEDDEGHFVPPEPPPLPAADPTSTFAWLGVIGGPVLLLLAVLFGWDMTWWLATLCIGGFLGGFATLVVRMRPDDEDDIDPGRGAVV